MKNPVYRIKVELIDTENGKHLDERMLNGIECEGFVILAKKGNGSNVVLQDISNIDIATIIAQNNEMMGASIIAKAILDAMEINRKGTLAKILEGFDK